MKRDDFDSGRWSDWSYDEDDLDARPWRPRIAPGKVTLTSRLPPGPPRLQARAQDGGGLVASAVDPHAVAARGVAGPGGSLPHGERIQAAFGRHDLGGVRAHVGGAAAEAARQLGAVAFATGKDVAFASPPDLHTAAHEAAHVIQQRAGVSLAGGVGRAGDVHEQQADQVADAVVRGASAEPLLDRLAGAGGSGRTLQRRDAGGAPPQHGVDLVHTGASAPQRPVTESQRLPGERDQERQGAGVDQSVPIEIVASRKFGRVTMSGRVRFARTKQSRALSVKSGGWSGGVGEVKLEGRHRSAEMREKGESFLRSVAVAAQGGWRMPSMGGFTVEVVGSALEAASTGDVNLLKVSFRLNGDFTELAGHLGIEGAWAEQYRLEGSLRLDVAISAADAVRMAKLRVERARAHQLQAEVNRYKAQVDRLDARIKELDKEIESLGRDDQKGRPNRRKDLQRAKDRRKALRRELNQARALHTKAQKDLASSVRVFGRMARGMEAHAARFAALTMLEETLRYVAPALSALSALMLARDVYQVGRAAAAGALRLSFFGGNVGMGGDPDAEGSPDGRGSGDEESFDEGGEPGYVRPEGYRGAEGPEDPEPGGPLAHEDDEIGEGGSPLGYGAATDEPQPDVAGSKVELETAGSPGAPLEPPKAHRNVLAVHDVVTGLLPYVRHGAAAMRQALLDALTESVPESLGTDQLVELVEALAARRRTWPGDLRAVVAVVAREVARVQAESAAAPVPEEAPEARADAELVPEPSESSGSPDSPAARRRRPPARAGAGGRDRGAGERASRSRPGRPPDAGNPERAAAEVPEPDSALDIFASVLDRGGGERVMRWDPESGGLALDEGAVTWVLDQMQGRRLRLSDGRVGELQRLFPGGVVNVSNDPSAPLWSYVLVAEVLLEDGTRVRERRRYHYAAPGPAGGEGHHMVGEGDPALTGPIHKALHVPEGGHRVQVRDQGVLDLGDFTATITAVRDEVALRREEDGQVLRVVWLRLVINDVRVPTWLRNADGRWQRPAPGDGVDLRLRLPFER
jgi:hypothetical protein